MARFNQPLRSKKQLIYLVVGASLFLTALFFAIYYFPFFYQKKPIVSDDGIRIPVADRQGRWGYIDERGRTVIPFIYSKAAPFIEQYAIVRKDAKSFFIDRSGTQVSSQYSRIMPFDSDGLAHLTNGRNFGSSQ